jgi:hypothetical protein
MRPEARSRKAGGKTDGEFAPAGHPKGYAYANFPSTLRNGVAQNAVCTNRDYQHGDQTTAIISLAR